MYILKHLCDGPQVLLKQSHLLPLLVLDPIGQSIKLLLVHLEQSLELLIFKVLFEPHLVQTLGLLLQLFQRVSAVVFLYICIYGYVLK